MSLGLSYNSQAWRKDSGGTWRLGRDVGYGFGWRLQAGSITPVYLDGQIHHYTFVDGTGAAYRLDVNTNGIWSSKESTYLYYNPASLILHFPDGSFWTFYCESAGTEQDSGSRYPTTVQDSNGNRAGISYQPGIGSSGQNTSARIIEVEDVRSTNYTGGWGSFEFFYDADTVPHLTGIKARFATGVEWQFQYLKHQTLTSPFSPPTPAWTTDFLQSVESVGLDLTHHFEYDSASGELTQVTFPYGGYLRWEYRDFTFSDGRTLREVQNRYLKTMPGGSETTYAFARNESDSSLLTHSAGFLNGPSGNGQKAWFFTTTGDAWRIGLQSSFEERPGAGQTSKRKQEYTWTRNSTLNPYVSEVLSTADQGQAYAKQSKTTQVLDAYGNVTQTNLYGYTSLTTPVRTYTSTYLTGSEYASRYIFNRLLSSTLSDGTNQLTLATNTYDTGTLTDVTGLTLHDGAYGTSLAYRGNVTQRVANGLTTNYTFDITGTVRQASDGQGHSVAIDTGGPNTSVPTLITPNSQSNLAQSYTYNDFLGVTAATGPNSSTATTAYDDYTRPTSTTSPTGAVTDFTYNNAERTTTATTNGRWTRTTTDGLGRTIKVETGHGSTTVSTVDTEYDSCGCSPLGKVKRVSQPYAPGGTVYWTTYSYDCLGRTVSVAQPGNSGTNAYVYEGNAVTVTSPSGKWKKYTTDALGNSVQVTEPDPSLGNVQSNYTYNLRGQLTEVSMPRGGTTQTRTFVYDLPTGRLTSATNPENGTVSYTYNADGSVATKTDAKNQVESYTYDAHGRTTQITRTANGQEDPCRRVNLYYDYNPFDEYFTENGWGRLTATQYGNPVTYACYPDYRFREMYSYTTAGLPTLKQFERSSYWIEPSILQADYTYDNEGRTTSVTYPATACQDEYGDYIPCPRATFTYSFDEMGRPVALNQTAQESRGVVSDVVYNAAGQITEMKTWSGGYRLETRQYNALQQLTRLTMLFNGATKLDYEYRFSATQNDGRITQRKDWLSGEEVEYQYDSLQRLSSAATTGTGGWGQSFGYDGFGNLLSQTVTKGSAPSMSVTVNPATNRITSTGVSYDANGNMTEMPGLTMTYAADNRMATATDGSAVDTYGYDPSGRRVYKSNIISFYGVDGSLLGEYAPNYQGFDPAGFNALSTSVYFGKRLVQKGYDVWARQVYDDRLGSVEYADTNAPKYFPYGDEATATDQSRRKFATYYRDSVTALDYAQQRYYASTLGRFTTPDPWIGSANVTNPISWNRYAYVLGDPVNLNDPLGLCPPGMVEADAPDQVQSIIDTARSYLNQDLLHTRNSNLHFRWNDEGKLIAIDCTGLLMQALAGVAYSDPFQQARITNLNSNVATLFSEDSLGAQVGDILRFPSLGHVVIVTGVSDSGEVTSFIGSQSTPGPQEVNLLKDPSRQYWLSLLPSTTAYRPCVPAGKPQLPSPVKKQPSTSRAVTAPWWVTALSQFNTWLYSISIGPLEQVTSEISFKMTN